MGFKAFIRRHSLWLGLAAVLAPLAVLLAFQYRWLGELERASAEARRADVANFLEKVRDEVAYDFEKAGWTLEMSPQVFTDGKLGKAAYLFKKLSGKIHGVRSFFVVTFVDPDEKLEGHPLFFDPESGTVAPREWSDEVRAVMVATAPWHTLAHKWGELGSDDPVAEEHDPHYPVVLKPIADETSGLVGVAGMVLDPDDFARALPELAEKMLPKFFPAEGQRRHLALAVRDGAGELVYGDGGAEPDGETAMSFVYTGWRLSLAGLHAAEQARARRSFLLNVALSAALALLLVGGVVLALRTASKEMKLSQMKSDFVSNVSHELRTPLASIRVFGELLRLGRAPGPDKVREYGEYIETESRRLTQLINNLLDFSSIESGRKSYHFEATDVEEVVTETLEVFGVRLRQRGFRVAYTGPQEPLPEMRLDPGALAQALSNLLDNAVKYSDGNREIAVTLARRGGSVVISVQDWGVGIPRDEQAQIFERFHRVSTGLVHDVKGSGLGLAIVQHVVAAHGGRVTVESRSGQGSTFSIHLPLEAPEPVREAPAGRPAPGALGQEPA